MSRPVLRAGGLSARPPRNGPTRRARRAGGGDPRRPPCRGGTNPPRPPPAAPRAAPPSEPRTTDPTRPIKMFHVKHLFWPLFGAAPPPDGRDASRAPPGTLPPPNRRETAGFGRLAPPGGAERFLEQARCEKGFPGAPAGRPKTSESGDFLRGGARGADAARRALRANAPRPPRIRAVFPEMLQFGGVQDALKRAAQNDQGKRPRSEKQGSPESPLASHFGKNRTRQAALGIATRPIKMFHVKHLFATQKERARKANGTHGRERRARTGRLYFLFSACSMLRPRRVRCSSVRAMRCESAAMAAASEPVAMTSTS